MITELRLSVPCAALLNRLDFQGACQRAKWSVLAFENQRSHGLRSTELDNHRFATTYRIKAMNGAPRKQLSSPDRGKTSDF